MNNAAAAEIRIWVTGLASNSSGSDWWFEFNNFLCAIFSFTSGRPTEMLIQHH